MLDQLLTGGLWGFMLVFARIGAAITLLPGFGEAYVSPRVRLGIALAITFIVTPLVAAQLPELPGSMWAVLVLVGTETVIGLLFGTLARLLLVGLQTAGMIVAFQTSLASAMINDPASAQQGSIIGNFFVAMGVLLIFLTNAHHMLLAGLVDSYSLFAPGALPPAGDMADIVTQVVAASFNTAMQISAPYIVIGLVFYLGLGLLARLMPQVQVFFIAIPLQLLLSFVVMLLTISASMMWFLDRFDSTMGGFLAPG
jgi:flagellar biosynthetic protein FliR